MLRLLHVAPRYLPHIGGSSLRLKRILETLSGVAESHVIVPLQDRHRTALYDQPLPDSECIGGVQVHRVPTTWHLAAGVRKICQAHDISLVQVHNVEMLAYCALALRKRRIVVDVHTVKDLPWPGRCLAGWAIRRAAFTVVLSSAMKEHVVSTHGVSPEKIVIVYNGVDLEGFSSLEPRDPSLARALGLLHMPTIGYIGSFYPFQGVTEFVEAAALAIAAGTRSRFLMVGAGPQWEAVQSLIAARGIQDRVVLTGIVKPDMVAKYMALMDVVTIPRPRTPETDTAVPLKLIEAMAAGKPILATAVGGVTELLRHNHDAFVVAPTPRALAQGVIELEDNPALWERLGANARATASRMSWHTTVEPLIRRYRALEATYS